MASPVIADIGAGAAIVADLGGTPVPLICDLLLVAEAASGSSGDLSEGSAVAAPIVDGVLTLNVAQASSFAILLDQDVTDIVVSGWPPAGADGRFALYLTQDSVGGRTVAWPSAWRWSNGVAHSVSAAPGAIDCFVVVSLDGGGTIFANVVGLSYS